VVEQERFGAVVPAAQPQDLAAGAVAKSEEFIPVAIEAVEADRLGIRLEIRAGEKIITVNWPVSAAGACGEWLRALLR
jgi:hypothetical protein